MADRSVDSCCQKAQYTSNRRRDFSDLIAASSVTCHELINAACAEAKSLLPDRLAASSAAGSSAACGFGVTACPA